MSVCPGVLFSEPGIIILNLKFLIYYFANLRRGEKNRYFYVVLIFCFILPKWHKLSMHRVQRLRCP